MQDEMTKNEVGANPFLNMKGAIDFSTIQVEQTSRDSLPAIKPEPQLTSPRMSFQSSVKQQLQRHTHQQSGLIMPALRPKFEIKNKGPKMTNDLAFRSPERRKPLSISLGNVQNRLAHEESFVGNFNILPQTSTLSPKAKTFRRQTEANLSINDFKSLTIRSPNLHQTSRKQFKTIKNSPSRKANSPVRGHPHDYQGYLGKSPFSP